jgi:hypothetical protein
MESTVVRWVRLHRDGCWRDQWLVARPEHRPWSVRVLELPARGFMACARREYCEGSGGLGLRMVETWWTPEYSDSASEAVRELRAVVRDSLSRGARR